VAYPRTRVFDDQHLTVSIRAFRAEKVSAFVKAPCEATATLYPIASGVPQIDKAIGVPVTPSK
jgi:hypothetical protein